jgi:hypothetical protein
VGSGGVLQDLKQDYRPPTFPVWRCMHSIPVRSSEVQARSLGRLGCAQVLPISEIIQIIQDLRALHGNREQWVREFAPVMQRSVPPLAMVRLGRKFSVSILCRSQIQKVRELTGEFTAHDDRVPETANKFASLRGSGISLELGVCKEWRQPTSLRFVRLRPGLRHGKKNRTGHTGNVDGRKQQVITPAGSRGAGNAAGAPLFPSRVVANLYVHGGGQMQLPVMQTRYQERARCIKA